MSEWGPWIEHDKGACPCVGQYVHIINKFAGDWHGIASGGKSWTHDRGYDPVIRYRIRKPRGMTILESLLENLPDEVTA